MKFYLPILLLFCFTATSNTSYAAVFHPNPSTEVRNDVDNSSAIHKKGLSRKELRKAKRTQRRAFRKALFAEFKKQKQSGGSGDVELILLVILALILPPLAMFLYDGEASGRFWISLGLALLAIPLWGTLGALAALGSVVYTLYIIISESL